MRHPLLPLFAALALLPACKVGDDVPKDDTDTTGDTDGGETDAGDTDPADTDPADTDPADTDVTLYEEACPTPQAVNTICAEVSGYGSRVFTVTSLNGGQSVASAPGRGDGSDGIGLQHAPANLPEVPEGSQDCAGLFMVRFSLSDGDGGSTSFTTEADGGDCTIVTTTGGHWEHEPLEGTFTATVVADGESPRTITGSFHYDKSAL